MYEVVFYESKPGFSQLFNNIDALRVKAENNNKDARIQHAQIAYCIKLLQINGTRLGYPYSKHLINDLWELRPGNNRIFYFFHKDNKFVLLHIFRKKTQKTPKHEIEKALKEVDDYINKERENKK